MGGDPNAKPSWEGSGVTGDLCVAVETFSSDDLGYWETTVPVRPRSDYVVSFWYRCSSASISGSTTGDPLYNKGRACGPNLELGVVSPEGVQDPKPMSWTDIGVALGPVGGTYLPPSTRWVHYQQPVTTVPNQTGMKLKLRMFCSAQKVWFDDLSVVDRASLPELTLVSPAPKSTVGTRRPVLPLARSARYR